MKDNALDDSRESSNIARPPFGVKLAFAIGQFGWSLATFCVFNQLAYFYLPPETGTTNFPTFIYQGSILGVLTVIGLISFGGRVLDAITDPWIANLSDRSSSKLGKRRLFMLLGAFPLALCSYLVFYPISDSTQLNSIWLGGTIVLFYIAFTIYSVPYAALFSELSHNPKDRMQLSTMISVTWAIGFFVGNIIFVLQSHFESTMSPTAAFQQSVLLFSVVSFIAMLVPVLFVKEQKYCKQAVSKLSIKDSMAQVMKNANFRNFAISDMIYWLALTIIQSGIVYYVTVLLQYDKAFTTYFMGGSFILSIVVFYALVNWGVKRFGKKRVMSFGFLIFGATFLLGALLGNPVLPKMAQLVIMGVMAAIPLAIFGIVPNAVLADIVYVHERKTRKQLAGMFFAVRTVMMKFGIALGSLLFPSFLLLGRSVDNDFGIRFSGFAALTFCVLGFILFQRYRDET